MSSPRDPVDIESIEEPSATGLEMSDIVREERESSGSSGSRGSGEAGVPKNVQPRLWLVVEGWFVEGRVEYFSNECVCGSGTCHGASRVTSFRASAAWNI